MTTSKKIKKIAIVVDDNKRTDLIEWSYFNKDILCQHEIIANEITADLLKGTLNIPITTLLTGTADGHRELANLLERKAIEILIFFGNPAKADIHQTGISDLLVLAGDQNILTACNRITADLIIGSLEAQSTQKTKKEDNQVSSNATYISKNKADGLSSFAGIRHS